MRQRRGVVHAVTHHGDVGALGDQLTDGRDLVFGQQVGPKRIDAHLLRHGPRDALVVAREHHDRRDVQRAQAVEHRADVLTRAIGDADHADERRAVPHHDRAATGVLQARHLVADAHRHLDLQLLPETQAADLHRRAADGRAYAACGEALQIAG